MYHPVETRNRALHYSFRFQFVPSYVYAVHIGKAYVTDVGV